MNIIPDSSVYFCRGVEINKSDQRDFLLLDEQYSYFSLRQIAAADRCYFIRTSGLAWSGSVKVAIPYLTLYNCDYLFYRNSGFLSKYFYAYIDSVEYIDTNTTRVNFSVDHYQTWLLDYSIRSGLVVREHLIDDNSVSYNVLKNSELFISGMNRNIGHATILNTGDLQYILIYCRYTAAIVPDVAGEVNGLATGTRVYFCRNNRVELTGLLALITQLGLGWTPYKACYFVDITGGLTNFVNENPLINYIGAGVTTETDPVVFNTDIDLDLKNMLIDPINGLGVKNYKTLCSPCTTFLINLDFGISLNDLDLSNTYDNSIKLRITETIIPDPVLTILIIDDYAGNPTTLILTCGLLSATSGFPQIQITSDNKSITDIAKGIFQIGKFGFQVWSGITGNPIAPFVKPTPMEYFLGALTDGKHPDQKAVAKSIQRNRGVDDDLAALFTGTIQNRVRADAQRERILNTTFDMYDKYKDRLELSLGLAHKVLTTELQGEIAILQALCTKLFNIYYNLNIALNYEQVDSMFLRLGYLTLEYKVPNTKLRPFWNYIQMSDCVVTGDIPEEAKRYIELMYNSGVTFWHDDDIYNYDRDNV